MIYVVVQKFVLTGQAVFSGVMVTLFFLLAVMAIAYVLLMESRKDKKPERHVNAQGAELDPPDTAKLLVDPPFEPVPSVVENTTELLKAERSGHKI